MINKLMQYAEKHRTIELYKLIEMFGNKTTETVKMLEKDNVLIPVMASGTDGNIRNPLYKKYRICTPKQNYSDTLCKINNLHPKLIANGFLLKKPSTYEKEQLFIDTLNTYLCNKRDNFPISRRERSLIIFNDEKVLDNHTMLLSSLGITESDLSFYTTPEQCFSDFIPKRTSNMTLLICENKDIWYNIRKIMFEDEKFSLFGVNLDGVIFGQGNDITGKDKFTSYAKYLTNSKVCFLYCGDIDKAGFDIFFRLKASAPMLDISIFSPIYEKMLELCNIEKLPNSDDSRNIGIDISRALSTVTYNRELLKRILLLNKRLPQEIINYQILKENMR